ncbi:hypothetical protein OPV22_024730 [Ensete ventricosum]|uniref:DRBM domain-containing protein n=1 Tax=Ensete ventricosum TaxID=4639 RepID=A0AAV8QFQ0_ENSVE|nr:hypothetical protein OPV22_024730 [Ensete ventricosum]
MGSVVARLLGCRPSFRSSLDLTVLIHYRLWLLELATDHGDDMKKFDDRFRDFDNFQLWLHVRCSSLTSLISWGRNANAAKKEAAFALAALMEGPRPTQSDGGARHSRTCDREDQATRAADSSIAGHPKTETII